MEHHAAGSPPSVVEVVIEGTLEFEIIYEIRPQAQAPPAAAGASSQTPLRQDPPTPKVRPVATIRPTPVDIKRETLTQDEDQKANLSDNSETSRDEKETANKSLTNLESKGSSLICDTHGLCDWGTSKAKIIVDENYNTIGKALCVHEVSESSALQEDLKLSQGQQTGEQTQLEQYCFSQSNSTDQRPTKSSDPCWVHRDWLRKASAGNKQSTLKTHHISAKKMECVNGIECHEGEQGYQNDKVYHVEKKPYQTSITECLEEFLEDLHLGHLKDYLRVLGCTCVRDLRLLEQPELDAIQLISRRRLLEQLNSLNLHHEDYTYSDSCLSPSVEFPPIQSSLASSSPSLSLPSSNFTAPPLPPSAAPPSDCSLEGWLTWYGLTHISGFLQSIGVHSVADMSYLQEEDLQLLKPVTRRRIIACHRKQS